jgi:hypothetical protein
MTILICRLKTACNDDDWFFYSTRFVSIKLNIEVTPLLLFSGNSNGETCSVTTQHLNGQLQTNYWTETEGICYSLISI